MPRHRHRHSKPQFPVSEPVSVRPERPVPKQGFSMDKVISLLDDSQFEEAFELLDSAPKWMQREPEFGLVCATALMEYGDLDAAGDILRELERKNPKFIPLYIPLAAWYMAQEWPAHALKVARKVLAAPKFDDQASEQAQMIADGASQMIRFLASELDLPEEKAEQASWYNEQAQLAVLDKNLTETERMTKEALKIAPQWTAPRNNYAHALYTLGKYQEAIAQAETVLASDPDNIHGLNNLILFHVGLGNTAQAAEYVQRLFDLAPDYDDDANEMDVIISALALAEDSDHLWELAQRYRRKPSDMLMTRSWHILGVAAVRLGHFREAKKFLEYASEDDERQVSGEVLESVMEAIHKKAEKLLWPPMYPGLELILPERILLEWTEIAEKVTDNQPSPSQKRKIDALLAKYPILQQVFKRMLWIEQASMAGASGLVMLNKPEADAEILRFALSDWGDNNSRMEAVMMLIDADRYSPEEPVRFWNAEKGEWTESQLYSQRIDDVEYNIKPQTAELIGKSQRAKDPQEAIAFLRRAVENEPTCAMAIHNLGALLTQQGQHEEGEALIRRSIEVDPTYTFGFANLGLLESQRGNKETALDLLMTVTKAKVITPDTAAVSNLAHAVLALADEDFERARRHFETAREMKPNHPMLKSFEERLELAEKLLGPTSFLRQYQEKSAHRFHNKALNTPLTAKMDLKSCLTQLTNETLVAMCRFWETKSYGKKQPMVERLTEQILDEEIFDEISKVFTEKERDALKWILDAGGWQLWEDFTAKFGDDLDESPWWKYHDPESIPGRLKLAGLLYAGTLEGQQVAFLPVDVRPLVKGLVN
jgi:tetratricopeptide (TPR) repeat protein